MNWTYLSDGAAFTQIRNAAKAEAINVATAYSSKSGTRMEVRQLRPADLDSSVITEYNKFTTSYAATMNVNSAIVIYGWIDFDANALAVTIENGTYFITKQFLAPIFNTLEKQGASAEFKEWGEFLENTQPTFIFDVLGGVTTLNLFPLAFAVAVTGSKKIVTGASSTALTSPV